MDKNISKVEKLIAELCPKGVEFKSIGELCQINRGRVMSKDYLLENAGKYPVYSSQTGRNGVFGYIKTYDYAGEYVTWTTDGANAGSVFYHNEEFSITNVCGLLKPKRDDLSVKYLLYSLGSVAKSYVKAGMGNPKLMSNTMEAIKIPVPPIAIQEEIAAIIDEFTELEAELETGIVAELEARKKQYAHHREKLFTFGEGISWKTLGEIGTLIRGNGLQKKDFVINGIGCIHYGQIYTHYGTFTEKTKSFVSKELAKKLKKINKGDLVIASTSENIEDICKAVAWLGDDEIVTGGHSIIFKHEQNPKYLAYYFQTKSFFDQKKKYAIGTKVIEVSAKKLANVKVQIVPIAEQEHIVMILDEFEELLKNISISLTAELSARRLQYEYYQRKLLTFKEYAK